MSSHFIELYVKDRYTNTIHRIGEDKHDSLYVDKDGTVHYYNLQNGDGCTGYKSAERITLKEKYPDNNWGERADELVSGYEFVSCYNDCQYCETNPCVSHWRNETAEEEIVRLYYGMSESMQKAIKEIMLVTQENNVTET